MRGVATWLVLSVPAAVLGTLAGFALTRPDDRAVACAAWAREYREARSDLVAVENYAWGARGYVVPEVDHLQSRVDSLTRARPTRCGLSGRIR